MNRSWWVAFALGLGLMLAAPLAGAVSDADRAGARAAANAGADAYEAGNYQQAIDFFNRAESLVHSPVHLVYLARSHLELNNLVEAHEAYLKIQREGAPAGASDSVKASVEEANAELEKIKLRLPYLTVKIEGADPGEAVTVKIGDRELPAALIGIPAPVNPGERIVRATTDTKDSGEVPITLTEGERQELVVTLQSTGAAPPAEPAATDPSGEQSPIASGPAPEAAVDRGTGSSGMRIGSYVALGVGVVGVGLGAFFALDSKSAADEADELCGGSREMCVLQAGATEDDVNSKNDQAGSSQTLAIVGFAVGGAAIATGVTLLVLSMGSDSGQALNEPGIQPYVGLSNAGVVGRF